MKNTRLECVSSKLVTNLTAKYIVQSVESCSQATFHCVQLWRRTDNVIQIKIGKIAPSSEDACHEQLFFDSSVATHTLTSEFQALKIIQFSLPTELEMQLGSRPGVGCKFHQS